MTDSPAAAGRFSPGTKAVLISLLFFGVLTLWVRERWAVSVLEAGTYLLGITAAWLWAKGSLRVHGFWPWLPLAGAVGWGLVQLATGWTVYRFDTWNAVLFWTAALILAFAPSQMAASAEDRHSLLRILLYFGFGVSVLAIIQYFTSEGKVFWLFRSGYPDALGPFVYRNNYAAFVELLLPVAIVGALRDRRRVMLYTVMAAVLYASVIASASRAGSILVTLEIPLVLLLARRGGLISARSLATTAAKIVLLAAVFVAVVGWRVLWERFDQQDPFVHRREMLQSALAMARDRPLAGFGLGTFEEVYPAYATFDLGVIVNHAHNDWAEWLAEGGVPFLVLLGSVGIWAIMPAVRSLWGIGLISVFLHAMVDYPLQRLGLAAWIFVFLGVLAAEERDRRERA